MYKIILAGVLLTAVFYAAHAQNSSGALVVSTCGALPQQYAVGATRQMTVNTNGQVCQ